MFVTRQLTYFFITLLLSAFLYGCGGETVTWSDPPEQAVILPENAPPMLAAGNTHNLLLKEDGSLEKWGYSANQPIMPLDLAVVVKVAAGRNSLALDVDGKITAWNDTELLTTHASISGLKVIDMDAYSNTAIYLGADGSITEVDYYGSTALREANETATSATTVAIGGDSRLALNNDGSVDVWNKVRLLGQSDSDIQITEGTTPKQVTDVVAIAAGQYHSMALRADGTVVSWGRSSDNNIQDFPSNLTRDVGVIAIAAGYWHSLALKADGSVVGWGDDKYSKGAHIVPEDLNNVIAIAAGEYHSVALTADGTIVEWGHTSSN